MVCRCIVPEIRSTALVLSRCVTLAISFVILTFIHHSPMLTLSACASLFAVATYLQSLLPQVSNCKMMENNNINDENTFKLSKLMG